MERAQPATPWTVFLICRTRLDPVLRFLNNSAVLRFSLSDNCVLRTGSISICDNSSLTCTTPSYLTAVMFTHDMKWLSHSLFISSVALLSVSRSSPCAWLGGLLWRVITGKWPGDTPQLCGDVTQPYKFRGASNSEDEFIRTPLDLCVQSCGLRLGSVFSLSNQCLIASLSSRYVWALNHLGLSE